MSTALRTVRHQRGAENLLVLLPGADDADAQQAYLDGFHNSLNVLGTELAALRLRSVLKSLKTSSSPRKIYVSRYQTNSKSVAVAFTVMFQKLGHTANGLA